MGTSRFNDGRGSLVGLPSRPGGMHSCRHLQTHQYNMAYLAKQVRISSGGVRGLGQCRFQLFYPWIQSTVYVYQWLIPSIDPPLVSCLTLNQYSTSRSRAGFSLRIEVVGGDYKITGESGHSEKNVTSSFYRPMTFSRKIPCSSRRILRSPMLNEHPARVNQLIFNQCR